MQSVNPLSSTTAVNKNDPSDFLPHIDEQLNHATSGYLSEVSSYAEKAGNELFILWF